MTTLTITWKTTVVEHHTLVLDEEDIPGAIGSVMNLGVDLQDAVVGNVYQHASEEMIDAVRVALEDLAADNEASSSRDEVLEREIVSITEDASPVRRFTT